MKPHYRVNLSPSMGVCLILMLTVTACAAEKPFITSPEFDKSNVTFNLQAEQAKEVLVVGQWDNWQHKPMAKNDRGTWTLRVEAMPAGIWSYYFLVDGLEINDPNNPVMQASRELNASVVQVPSDPPAPWDPQNIPHGVLHTHQYFSTALGRERELIVYTPPGYSASAPPLPVLYLAQGFGGNEKSWTVEGKAHWIEDAMIASKSAVPMIIVMPNSHALPYAGEKFGVYLQPNTDAYVHELREDVRPLVESNYNARKDGDGRAFVGLSMGGGHAFMLGLNYPDEFTWIAALSPSQIAMDKIKSALDKPETVNSKQHLFWVPAGRWESPEQTQKYVDQLRAAGLKPEFELVEGNHSWPNWRGDLVKLLPRLFK